MAVHETTVRPVCLGHFPDDAGYRWLDLRDAVGVYGNAAFKERDEVLELHLTLARWGPGVRRCVVDDLQWVRAEAERLGKKRILGVRADSEGCFDPNLFRFGRLLGFSDFCVLQTMALEV